MGDNGLCVNEEASLLATVTMFHLPKSLSRDLVPSLWDYSSNESEIRSQLGKIRFSSQTIYSREDIHKRMFRTIKNTLGDNKNFLLKRIPEFTTSSQSFQKILELSAKNSRVQCTRARDFSHVCAHDSLPSGSPFRLSVAILQGLGVGPGSATEHWPCRKTARKSAFFRKI